MNLQRLPLVLGVLVTSVALIAGAVALLYPPSVIARGTTTIGGITYEWESVRVVTNPLSGPYDVAQTIVDFQSVHFRLFIYDTVDCPVLNVSGTEPTGVSYSFVIYPIPFNCEMRRPTVISIDGTFGASWQGRSTTVSLLVRVS